MPYVWVCTKHGPQAISFREPDLLSLAEDDRLVRCPVIECDLPMGYTYRE